MLTALVALVFIGAHLASPKLTFLRTAPRSRWLSIGGGVSAAYVFTHLLPELAEHQAGVAEGYDVMGAELAVFVTALLGLVVFYGLERYAKTRARRARAGGRAARTDHASDAVPFTLHVGSFALYNVLIGYLLVHREEPDLRGLILYGVAMTLHFVVNDRALDEHHGPLYRRFGAKLLAAAVALGWLIGLGVALPDAVVAALFAFLAGGVIMNVMKEELPEERESRFWAFVAGAAVYAGLVLATHAAEHEAHGAREPAAAHAQAPHP